MIRKSVRDFLAALIIGVAFFGGGSVFAQTSVPKASHVFLVLEENHSYSSVIGSSAMPYLNSLAQTYGLATQYYANTHPSIGNYFEFTTGQIVTNNDGATASVSVDNIVRHFLTAGITWKSYAESLPSVGYTGGDVYPYARHHNPFSYFTDVVNSSTEKLNLVPFTHFKSDLANDTLPQFSYIVPNMLDDAHDGSLQQADSWLRANIGPVLASSAFQNNGLMIIVFDESLDTDTAHGGGHVAMLVLSPNGKPGYKSTTLYQHQSTLRLAMEALGLTSFPGAAATAANPAEFFGTSSGPGGCASTTLNTVRICAPVAGLTSASPVYVSAASSSQNAVTAMQIYVDYTLHYQVSGGSISTSLPLSAGSHRLDVKAWTTAGTNFMSTVNVTVP